MQLKQLDEFRFFRVFLSSAKALPSVALSKVHLAKIFLAKRLCRVLFIRALGKIYKTFCQVFLAALGKTFGSACH